jgi:hypothetical protein
VTWRFPFSTLRNVIAASIAMGLIAWWVYGMAGNVIKLSLVHLIISIGLAVLTYFVCLWCLGEVKDEEKNKILQVCFRLVGKEAPTNSGRR